VNLHWLYSAIFERVVQSFLPILFSTLHFQIRYIVRLVRFPSYGLLSSLPYHSRQYALRPLTMATGVLLRLTLDTRSAVAVRLPSRFNTAIPAIPSTKFGYFSDCRGASHLTPHAKSSIGQVLGIPNAAVVVSVPGQRSTTLSMYSRGIITGCNGRDILMRGVVAHLMQDPGAPQRRAASH